MYHCILRTIRSSCLYFRIILGFIFSPGSDLNNTTASELKRVCRNHNSTASIIFLVKVGNRIAQLDPVFGGLEHLQ